MSKLVIEGISANSTAFLEEMTPGEKPKGVGNPTEVALLCGLIVRNVIIWNLGRARRCLTS